MVNFQNKQFLKRSIFKNLYVGNLVEAVRALGDRGQRLVLTGENHWQGGVGAVTNNEVFGGEDTGANWDDGEDGGHILVASRQALLIAVGGGSPDMSHTGSGTPNIDGDLTIKASVRVTGSPGSEADWPDSAGAIIGFTGTADESDGAVWKLKGSGTDWKPYVETGLGASLEGPPVALVNDTYHQFKIIVKDGSVEFYIDGDPKVTLSSNTPDGDQLHAFFGVNGATMRIKRVFVQYGAT